MTDPSLDSPAGDPAWRFRGFYTWPASLQAQADFLDVTGSLAALSRHPAAAELHRVARWNGRGLRPVAGFQDFGPEGFGGAVRLAGEPAPRAALVGVKALLERAGLSFPELLAAAVRGWGNEGLVLYAGWDAHARAALRFGG